MLCSTARICLHASPSAGSAVRRRRTGIARLSQSDRRLRPPLRRVTSERHPQPRMKIFRAGAPRADHRHPGLGHRAGGAHRAEPSGAACSRRSPGSPRCSVPAFCSRSRRPRSSPAAPSPPWTGSGRPCSSLFARAIRVRGGAAPRELGLGRSDRDLQHPHRDDRSRRATSSRTAHTPAEPLVVLLACAERRAWCSCAARPTSWRRPFYLNMPMISPAFPALRHADGDVPAVHVARRRRVVWSVIIAHRRSARRRPAPRTTKRTGATSSASVPTATSPSASRFFPTSRRPPPPAAIRSDSALARHARRRRRERRRRSRRQPRGDRLARAGARSGAARHARDADRRPRLSRKARAGARTRAARRAGSVSTTLRQVMQRLHPEHRAACRGSVRQRRTRRRARCRRTRWEAVPRRRRPCREEPRPQRPRRRRGVVVHAQRQRAVRVGRVAGIADRRRRLFALPVAVRWRRHSVRHANRRPLDARHAADKGALDLRHGWLPARVRRAQPGKCHLGGAGLGHGPSDRSRA